MVVATFSRVAPKPARLKTRRMRSGQFTVVVPNRPGARYSIRVKQGKTTLLARTFTVSATQPAPAQPTPPPNTPPAVQPPVDPCDSATTLNGSITLNAASYRAGEAVAASVLNTGTACFGGIGPRIERQSDSDPSIWTAVPDPPGGYPEPALNIVVRPGESIARDRLLPADAQPGVYRVRVVLASTHTALTPVTITSPFTVTSN